MRGWELPVEIIYLHDIAIIEFTTDAPKRFKPILLNSNNNLPGDGAYLRVSGYGSATNDTNSSGTLREVDVPVLSYDRCSQLLASNGAEQAGFHLITDFQFCTGGENGKCDTCYGDIGGPIITYDAGGRPVLVGISSFGYGCGDTRYPNVNTRVSAYLDIFADAGAVFKSTNKAIEYPQKELCFPAEALVTLHDGMQKSMDQLEIGDIILTGAGEYSPVFMFTHRRHFSHHNFIELNCKNRNAYIILSSGHYLPINGRLAAAHSAQIGDFIELGDGSLQQISSVTKVVRLGLFNPQTLNGYIVVNGVKASTYTTAIQPVVAHSMLRPLGLLYKIFGMDLSRGMLEK